eukprot:gene14649-19680_t
MNEISNINVPMMEGNGLKISVKSNKSKKIQKCNKKDANDESNSILPISQLIVLGDVQVINSDVDNLNNKRNSRKNSNTSKINLENKESHEIPTNSFDLVKADKSRNINRRQQNSQNRTARDNNHRKISENANNNDDNSNISHNNVNNNNMKIYDYNNSGIKYKQSSKSGRYKNSQNLPKQSGILNPTAAVFEPKVATNENHKTETKAFIYSDQKLNSVLNTPICSICASESFTHSAVGECNHPICSICALRIRSKSRDKSCPICKHTMEFMIVFPATLSHNNNHNNGKESEYTHRSFESFGVVDDTPLPGVMQDHSTGLLFVDCIQHFRELEEMKAFRCPLKSCGERLSSEKLLLNHMSSRHDGLSLCPLCVEHRPLFISEHTVFTKKQLNAHLKPNNNNNNNNDNNGQLKHPLCEFCNNNHFDSHQLYLHMQSIHFTCHLCPQQMMFRYYRDTKSLDNHLRNEHITCELCDSDATHQSYGVSAYTFKNYNEFSDHMYGYHGNNRNANIIQYQSRVRRNFNSNYQNDHDANRIVDLDMGSANPFPTNNSNNGNHRNNIFSRQNNNNNNNNNAVTMDGTNSIFQIPQNMQIAGRVTGTGRFSKLDKEDVLLQSAIDEANSNMKMRNDKNNKNKNGIIDDESFPTLGMNNNNNNMNLSEKYPPPPGLSNNNNRNNINNKKEPLNDPPQAPPTNNLHIHPLSIINTKIKQKNEMEQKKQKELEESELRRIKRNERLLESLLFTSHDESSFASNNNNNRLFIQKILLNIEGMKTEAEIGRVLYPPSLVIWAKNNRVDLLKIEKKMSELINTKYLTSVQLKPMASSMRTAVHHLARYYNLNSYEFDPEPKRYISLVKTIDSAVPSMLLSASSLLPVPIIPPINPTGSTISPTVYLSLTNPPSTSIGTTDYLNSANRKGQLLEIYAIATIVNKVLLIIMEQKKTFSSNHIKNNKNNENYDDDNNTNYDNYNDDHNNSYNNNKEWKKVDLNQDTMNETMNESDIGLVKVFPTGSSTIGLIFSSFEIASMYTMILQSLSENQISLNPLRLKNISKYSILDDFQIISSFNPSDYWINKQNDGLMDGNSITAGIPNVENVKNYINNRYILPFSTSKKDFNKNNSNNKLEGFDGNDIVDEWEEYLQEKRSLLPDEQKVGLYQPPIKAPTTTSL